VLASMDHVRLIEPLRTLPLRPQVPCGWTLFQVQLGKATSDDKFLTTAREDLENDETNWVFWRYVKPVTRVVNYVGNHSAHFGRSTCADCDKRHERLWDMAERREYLSHPTVFLRSKTIAHWRLCTKKKSELWQYRERTDRIPHSIFCRCDYRNGFIESGIRSLRSRYRKASM